ncbi:hypothetical protein HX079_18040, partial [Myroides odoratimimus]|uniref:AAA domain-containing protein n=1 Tax=Myroides odoratimimus TaxID=76832 RepID=UPI002575E679
RFKNVTILEQMIEFLVKGINELSGSGKNEIAVLTPYVDTLKILQQNLKQRTVAKNFLIESVDRVQGLDVDYCFYVVAKSSSFSFDTNRFNVATSRAKKVTFILVEENFDKLLVFSNEVVDFLEKFKKQSN